MSLRTLLSRRALRRSRLGPGLLLMYTGLCLFMALPGGSRLGDRKVWNSPHNQKQFEQWAASLSSLGVSVSGEDFQALLWDFTSGYLRTRDQALRRIRWIPEQLGISQSWRMFSSPQTHPSRLWLELDEGQGFRPLYVAGSNEHVWRRELLEHHRLRKLAGRLGRSRRESHYHFFGIWLARQAARDFPRGETLRVQVYTWETGVPGRVDETISNLPFARAGGKFARARLFRLSKYR